MRRTVPAAVALLALAALGPGTAHAAAGPAEGLRCGFTTLTAPFGDGRHSGTLDGGPVVVADGADPRAGRIRCTLQLNGNRHADADLVSVASVTTPGVAVLPPTTIEYDAAVDDTVYLCAQVEIEGAGTFYWDDDVDEWSTSPYAECDGALQAPVDDPIDRVLWERVVDPLLCPLLAAASPGIGPVAVAPEGDVSVAGSTVWDCPPYEWS
ncbi:MAG TPA: hypothetical protein VNQ77_14035 [Frankiaceae bacterium]|nr:hypothetical protein [Frankiaceae bacterium]